MTEQRPKRASISSWGGSPTSFFFNSKYLFPLLLQCLRKLHYCNPVSKSGTQLYRSFKLFINSTVASSTECKVKGGTMANLDDLEHTLVTAKACTNNETTLLKLLLSEHKVATGASCCIEAALCQAFWSSQNGRHCRKTSVHGSIGLHSPG